MRTYSQARVFHDVGGLRQMFTDAYLSLVQDSIVAKYDRFKRRFPSSTPVDFSPELRQFVTEFSGVSDEALIGAYSRALLTDVAHTEPSMTSDLLLTARSARAFRSTRLSWRATTLLFFLGLIATTPGRAQERPMASMA